MITALILSYSFSTIKLFKPAMNKVLPIVKSVALTPMQSPM